ncbi:MAG: hypothetical protein ACLRNQ_18470 [Flavonifractor plautii]
MKPLLSALNDIPEYRSLLAAIDNGACPAAFSGLSAVHRAHFAAGIRQELNRPVVVVCADEGRPSAWPGIWPPCRGGGAHTLCPGVHLPQRRGGVPAVRAPAAVHPAGAGGGECPCWSVRWSLFSSAPFPKPC